jgi:lysophospholipase L1-like esterase
MTPSGTWVRGNVRRGALRAGLLASSILLAGLLGEGAARIVLNRVDYLAVDPVYDSILGARLKSYAAGHDEWGFRNREVPDSAEVVAIGDSQTYGVSAPALLSWPAQLASLTGRRVYNLALGSYGPVQYEELLRTRALRLRPTVIVVGLYYGNDLWDAYTAVYGLRHWAGLRRNGVPLVKDSFTVAPPRDVALAGVRDWLARHSVIYRLLSFTPLGGVARRAEFSTREHTRGIVPFRHPRHGAVTGFTPLIRLRALDLANPIVQEGLRLTVDRLEQMAEECRQAHVHFLVALIPTKERVYAPWLEGRGDLPEHEALRVLVRNELEANRRIRDRLDQIGVRYVDLELPLRDAADQQAIYPSSDDGHPNAPGYQAIAQTVAVAIRDWLP